MTPDQIQIVRTTFGRIFRDADRAAALFYERLFTIAPETRAMFKGDMAAQGRKLMDTLNVAVATLRDPASLAGILDRLGRVHAAHGVQPRHYDRVGEALLWTLESALAKDFTPDVRAAWTALYGTVASAMQKAGAGAATPTAA